MGGEEHGLKGCRSAFLAVLLLSLALPAQAESGCARRAAACEALAGLRLPDVTIINARAIGRGKFTSPDGETHAVPAFCRIHGAARPSGDSLIHFELWLPAARWNGRYYQLGNGGFAGAIHYPSLAAEIRALNAVAATDTGHRASPFDAAWAQGHPEKIVDYGYRSLKSTSDAAQALIRAYYSAPAKRRYFIGCSNGGRQALMVAQRYPEDWDGVLAGAPAHDWTGQLTHFAAIQQALRNDSESWIPPSKLPAIQRAALESCTPAARVMNGVPTDPRFCSLDPAALVCRGEVTDECLTASQAAVLGRIQGVFEPTAALAGGHWANWMLNIEPRPESHLTFAEQFFRHMVFENPHWSVEALDVTRDQAFAKQKLGHLLDATSTDLARFERQGAKLLMYFGWADALISPRAGIDYYERVSERMGEAERTQSFFRLFMVPGMTHCQGGPAPHAFGQAQVAPALHDDALHDIRRALEAWVERGVAPDRIVAAKYVNDDPSQGLAMTATLYPLGGTHGRF